MSLRRDRRVAFEVCNPCRCRRLPGEAQAVSGHWPAAVLADQQLLSSVQVLLSRRWLLEHGPRPETMTFHVGQVTGLDGRRQVALTGVPDWEG